MTSDHMHPVRDYFIYIDCHGNVWKVTPTRGWEGPALIQTIIHKA